MFAKDLHPRAYVFSLCNEKIRVIIVRGTTRTKREISEEKYNLYQQNGIKGTHKWMELGIEEQGGVYQYMGQHGCRYRVKQKTKTEISVWVPAKQLLIRKTNNRYILLKWYRRGPRESIVVYKGQYITGWGTNSLKSKENIILNP